MTLIKNSRAWKKWAKEYDLHDSKPPVKYPCYGYEVCTSYAFEESEARYLYLDDLATMLLAVGGAAGKLSYCP